MKKILFIIGIVFSFTLFGQFPQPDSVYDDNGKMKYLIPLQAATVFQTKINTIIAIINDSLLNVDSLGYSNYGDTIGGFWTYSNGKYYFQKAQKTNVTIVSSSKLDSTWDTGVFNTSMTLNGTTINDFSEISGSGSMTPAQINDSLKLLQWFIPDDTIPVNYHENYMIGVLELTQDTNVIIDMSDIYESSDGGNELIFDFKVYNTGGNYKLNNIIASDGSRVNVYLNADDSMRTDAYKINRYICSLSEPSNGLYVIGCSWSRKDTITVNITPLYVLSAEIGTQTDSTINVLMSQAMTTAVKPQGNWTINYGTGTASIDTVYSVADTLKIITTEQLSGDSTLTLGYVQGDTLIYGYANDSILKSFSDTSIINNIATYILVNWDLLDVGITFDGETLTSTGTDLRAAQSTAITGDFILVYEWATNTSNHIFGISTTTGIVNPASIQRGVFINGTSWYKIENGSSTIIRTASVFNGDLFGIRRVGTTLDYIYSNDAGSTWNVLSTTLSGIDTQYIKVTGVDAGKIVYKARIY